MQQKRALAFFLSAGILTGGLSVADTLKVPSTNFPTIASAVAVANSGDTIQIAPNNANGSGGVYSEVIVVPNTKTGLQFVGSNVVWDGANGDTLIFTGPNDGVTVKGFIFRNGHAQVKITGNNATVEKCDFIGSLGSNSITIVGNFATISGVDIRSCFDDGINITGTDSIIEKCTFTAVDFPGIRLTAADRTMVTGCKFSRCDPAIQVASGDDVQILKNTIDGIAGDGIHATGKRIRIEGNKLLDIGGDAIQLLAGSDDAVILGNTIDFCANYGIFVSGAHATINKNKINNVSDGGIRIDAGSTAVLAGPTISANTIKRCLGDSGILVDADSVSILGNSIDTVLGFNRGIDVNSLGLSTQGGSIAKNKVTNAHEAGIRVGIAGVAVSENVVSKCGGGYNGGAGIHISLVNNCTLVGNKVTDIDGDGFQIEGNTNTLTDCSATKCVNDGFDLVSGDGNSLEGCVASSCFGEGFDNSNGVTGSIVKNSTFSKCRIDFAGNGTLAQDVNNTFTTGGAATAPVIDQL